MLPEDVQAKLDPWMGGGELIHFWEMEEIYFVTIYHKPNVLRLYRMFQLGGEWRVSQDSVIKLGE